MEVREKMEKAKEISVIRSWDLYEECNRNQWFTHGDCEQYDRMFDLNREEVTLNDLAVIIYICSDWEKWSFVDILDRLIEMNDEEWIPGF